ERQLAPLRHPEAFRGGRSSVRDGDVHGLRRPPAGTVLWGVPAGAAGADPPGPRADPPTAGGRRRPADRTGRGRGPAGTTGAGRTPASRATRTGDGGVCSVRHAAN